MMNKPIILIVDDNKIVLKTLAFLVTSLNYECMSATNGLEAVDLLKSHSVDLVITDVNMPKMDGMELLRHITRNYSGTDVIVATGYSERASFADVIKAGAIDYIKKPIGLVEMEAKLSRAIRERAMVRKLEELTMHDSLTSLLNRRAFDFHFHKEFERADRQGYSIYLAFIDIDNFKEFNDKYGHQKGDEILIDLGKILVDHIRHSVDLCFRIGGDEFALILPQTTAKLATEITQRILESYAKQDFGTTSLSIGIVPCWRNERFSVEDDEKRMKNYADQAMYDAKRKGKNCVVCKEEES